jgi:predicted transcriptional regulator
VIVLSEEATSKEKVCFQIQEFLLQKSANFIQIVEVCDAPKETVNDYLNELMDKKHIMLKSKRKQGIDKYALTDKGKDAITLLLEKQKIKTQIDQMSPEKFQEFKRFLVFMAKSKDSEEFMLHLSSTQYSQKIKAFKNLGTKTVPKK